MPWRRERLPTPVFWPGEFHGLYSPWGCKESDMIEWLSLSRGQRSKKKLFYLLSTCLFKLLDQTLHIGTRKWEESEVAFLQMLAVTSTTDGQCPIHIPSPFLCRLTMTSEWFAWVGRLWAWAGQKFKEWRPLGSDLKQMTDGSWWIKPPASSPQPYWSTQFSSVLSGNSLDNKPFIYFWLLSFSPYFSPSVSWEYLC